MPDSLDMQLAAERTALSWRRTCLGAVAVAVLLLRAALDAGWGAAALLADLACLLSIVVAALGYRRNRRLHRGAGSPGSATVCGVATAVAATVLVVVGFVLFTPGAG